MTKNIAISLAMLLCTAVAAQVTERPQEPRGQDYTRMATPADRETVDYIRGGEHWTGGVYNWYYNPANQPANLSTEAVLITIQIAASRWAQMCNLTFNYLGFSTANRNFVDSAVDRINVIGWQQFPTSQNRSDGLTYWNYTGTAMTDADIFLNTFYAWTLDDVDAVITHELGHAIGLQHSNISESIMFANPYHSNSYLKTLRGDDAAGCTALYGASPNQLTNRTLNFAETAYASALQGGPVVTLGTGDGYIYRYYPQSNSSAGAKDGVAYFTGPDGILRNMGPLNGYTPSVIAAGF